MSSKSKLTTSLNLDYINGILVTNKHTIGLQTGVSRTVALSQPILTMHTAPLFVAGNDSSVVDGSTKKGKHFP